jgi:1,2-diacylglycerol 3-alpha-glucosyltransferase
VRKPLTSSPCRAAVIWIDWYPYHVARFRGLSAAFQGSVVGIELVGGVGVHAGLKFREDLPADLPIYTLLPGTAWAEASQRELAQRLWRKLDELQPEIVLVPGYYTLPALAAAVWARCHRRTSVLMTESTATDHLRSGWKEWVKGTAMRLLFDWAVTGGTAHRAYLQQLGFPRERAVGFYDVVDNAFFAEGAAAARAQRASVPTTAPYFVYVGRLAPEKNVAGLVRSWIAYQARGGSWPLVLCGDGPERAALEATVMTAGLGEAVQFPGLLSAPALPQWYAGAGCFVLPSTREPWGLVTNEAMASGLPVLVSDRCGCTADLVRDGENGFCFDPADEDALCGLLHRMEQMPAEARAAMGRRSAEVIAAYSPAAFGCAVASVESRRPAALTTEQQTVTGGAR